jgi:hypothetical protein
VVEIGMKKANVQNWEKLLPRRYLILRDESTVFIDVCDVIASGFHLHQG